MANMTVDEFTRRADAYAAATARRDRRLAAVALALLVLAPLTLALLGPELPPFALGWTIAAWLGSAVAFGAVVMRSPRALARAHGVHCPHCRSPLAGERDDVLADGRCPECLGEVLS
jgi:hypothetical protein